MTSLVVTYPISECPHSLMLTSLVLRSASLVGESYSHIQSLCILCNVPHMTVPSQTTVLLESLIYPYGIGRLSKEHVVITNKYCSFRVRCDMSMNHLKDGVPHQISGARCKYNHTFDNKIFLCKVSQSPNPLACMSACRYFHICSTLINLFLFFSSLALTEGWRVWSLRRPLPVGSQAGWDWPNTHGQGEQLRKSMLVTVEPF